MRRLLAALVTTLAVLVMLAAPAAAHAERVGTTPAAGSRVEQLDELRIDLTEQVGLLPRSVRVFDADGRELDLDGSTTVTATSVLHAFDEPLPEGTWLVSWRFLSGDGHPVEGSFTFGVGVDPVLGAATTITSTSTALGVARGATTFLATLGTLLFAGALVTRGTALRRPAMRARANALARPAGRVALGATLASVPVHAALLLDVSLPQALAPSAIGALADSSVGGGIALRSATLLLALLALARGRERSSLLLSLAALFSFAVNGHTRTGDPAWLLTASDITHLGAAAVWLGGLVVLADLLRRRDGPVEDADARAMAAVVERFSAAATVALLAVTVTGTLMAQRLVAGGSIVATPYGRALVAKVALVAILAGIGAWNRVALVSVVRHRARPVLAGGAADTVPAVLRRSLTPAASPVRTNDVLARLRRTVRVEVAAIVAVTALTGALVDLSPPRPDASVALGGFVDVGGGVSARIDVVVDPRGDEDVAVRLIDPVGQPYRSGSVSLLAAQPSRGIGATEWSLQEVAPGRYAVADDLLPLSGAWDVTLQVRTGRFTVETRELVLLVPEATS